MATKKYHLQDQEIPSGYMIFEERLEVAGIQFRKDDALSFSQNPDGCWLDFEREENNKYDKNAIKVIGCRKGFIGIKRYFVGYVPKEISKIIIEGGYWGVVKPRLLKTYIGKGEYVEILFQLLGPKEKKHEYTRVEEIETDTIQIDRFADYINKVDSLLQEKEINEAVNLLMKMVNATENEAKVNGRGVIPGPYSYLANIYHKEKKYIEERDVLERFDKQPKAPGSLPKYLAKRLAEVKQILNK